MPFYDYSDEGDEKMDNSTLIVDKIAKAFINFNIGLKTPIL